MAFRGALDGVFSDLKVPVQPSGPKNEPGGIDFRNQVKIFHSDQIVGWTRFPSYEEATLISCKEYQIDRERILNFRSNHGAAFADREKVRELDHDELIDCGIHVVKIPGSIFGRHIDVALPAKKFDSIVVEASEGQVLGDKLRTMAGFWSRTADVTYRCRSRVWHAEELETIRARLLTLSEVLVREIETIEASQYNDPLLFISHRWESSEHPDPDGRQLQKLKQLERCFMVYDYTSFPQVPGSRTDIEGLTSILDNMHHLLKNVVILAGDLGGFELAHSRLEEAL